MNEPAQIKMERPTKGAAKALYFITVDSETAVWRLRVGRNGDFDLSRIHVKGRDLYQGPRTFRGEKNRCFFLFENNNGLRVLTWDPEKRKYEEPLVTPKIAWYLDSHTEGEGDAIAQSHQISSETWDRREQWRSTVLLSFARRYRSAVFVSAADFRTSCVAAKFALPDFLKPQSNTVPKKKATSVKKRRRPKVAA